jgi:hypothetical protein
MAYLYTKVHTSFLQSCIYSRQTERNVGFMLSLIHEIQFALLTGNPKNVLVVVTPGLYAEIERCVGREAHRPTPSDNFMQV